MEMLEWARKFEDYDYKVLARDQVGELTVMTVWSGLDWNSGLDDEAPLIFSTGVMRTAEYSSGEGFGLIEERYWSTEDEALEGHRAMMEKHDGDRTV